MPKKIEISHRTIIFTIFALAAVWFFLYIWDIVLQVFVALLLMTILNPTVTKLRKYGIPRAASVLIVYLLLISFIVFVFAILIPPLIEQSTNFANSLPKYLAELNIPINVVEQATTQLTDQLSQLPAQILKIGVSIVSNTVAVLAVFIFALYFLLAREKLDHHMTSFLSKERIKKVDKILLELEKDLGGWARGQMLLMLLVGVSTYVGLLILGVPFALPLALLAGLLEIIPNIGPFLASVPVILVGFGVSPLTGLAAAALAFLVQQVENYVFVPKVMEKTANVSPIVTLLSLVIGFRVAGVLGAILSVPIVITIRVLTHELVLKK